MARRTNGALGEIISTIVNVLTLPFRVLAPVRRPQAEA
jgi:hypothetical protein